MSRSSARWWGSLGLSIGLACACSDDPGGAEAEAGDATGELATDTAADDTSDDTTGGETEDGFEPYPWPEEALGELVDPTIGTGGVGYTVGTMNPGPSLPFGMIKPGPDTGLGPIQLSFLNCTGYHWDQTYIWGFSHSRINGMGVPDYGAVQVSPTLGMDADKAVVGGARSLFDHAQEQAAPGYYAVSLLEPGVEAELTATTRAARHRYTFDEPSPEATLVFNLAYNPGEGRSIASEVTIDPASATIRGMMTVHGSYSDRFGGVPTYFAARVSQPITDYGVWDDMATLAPGVATMTGAEIGAWLSFDLDGSEDPNPLSVELELAISYVSIEEAEANLAELDGQSFEDTRSAAAQAWDDELRRVRVLGGTDEERGLFYSAMYRAFLAPTTFTEASGAYRGFDGQVHSAEGFTYYSDFSLWDTYRTLHPLLNLIQRERHADMLQSLVMMAEYGGDLPKWPLGIGYTGGMLGTSADIVLADAYLKDVTGFDVDAAYAAARLHALEPRPNAGRGGIAGYRERGWVASEDSGASASRTLEFAHADYALSRWAEALGHADDAALFGASAGNWRNLWAPELEFLIGRRADGSFELDGFDPEVWASYYSEGTAHHYLWAVPHDVAGLAELMGGPEALRERLAAYFETSAAFLQGSDYSPLMPVPFYWQSNEPSLHDAYLFTEVGDPASTQRWVDWARRRHYGPGPDGLPGNDDAGTMSAWYVFASIGLYPLPGSDGYWITAPIFERVELDLSDAAAPERRLAIVADGAGPGMIYVAGASFNGVELERPWITWEQLRDEGGTLRLTLSDEPSDFGA
ncbi:Glycosyl hydrolase family 92 [Enhygromyxa salina]|uniref:Glycosyl hydrolase family 92 n=1 Tax=Enhygromyxa salina TaxID=215803 RepID=A0A2S9XG24_9BACT|nr:GH92 family glycosyl hydrolase [Enhygromyxa salina]PRP91816.1 Glycosyl hydrolase family 92 [Enhygromyxa salina]